MGKPILCLDFDGVIHSYASGWKGARNIPDEPVPGAIQYMLRMLAEGFDVVVHSSRGQSFGGIWAMRRWLRKHAGMAWYECPMGPGLEDVRFSRRKPAALITIDDRALTFNGDWSSPEYQAADIRAFKPWNKRPVLPCAGKPYCMAMPDLSTETGMMCDLCEAKWPTRDGFACVREPGQW